MIEFEMYIPLSPDLVWEKLVQPAHIQKWWGRDVTLNPVKGGKFVRAEQGASGFVTAIDPSRRLQFDYRLKAWPRATRVEIMLAPEKPGCRLCFQHSGWDALPDEVLRRKEVDAHTTAWRALMGKFTAYCAG